MKNRIFGRSQISRLWLWEWNSVKWTGFKSPARSFHWEKLRDKFTCEVNDDKPSYRPVFTSRENSIRMRPVPLCITWRVLEERKPKFARKFTDEVERWVYTGTCRRSFGDGCTIKLCNLTMISRVRGSVGDEFTYRYRRTLVWIITCNSQEIATFRNECWDIYILTGRAWAGTPLWFEMERRINWTSANAQIRRL
jgi:hypothetical protein